MRAYSASSEEALLARDLLKDWRNEGLLSADQYERMEKDTVCDLRRTNIFLRLVLLLFSLIITGAAVGLFFVVLFSHPGDQIIGLFLLFFGAASYAAAEIAVLKFHLYRCGIEEALLACSAGFLCVGMQLAFWGGLFSSTQGAAGFLVPAAGVIASLWIWYRFGLPYAFWAAMIFVALLPGYWTSLPWAKHLIVVILYCAGLITVIAIRGRYRFAYLNTQYSIAESLLWLGVYLAINLHLSSVDLLARWWEGSLTTEFPRPFYWTTWVLIWCLPPLVFVRGLRLKDRLVIAAGGIAVVLTLATNKPYLGWERHTWDPMLLGGLLMIIALLVRRWLAKAPGEIRLGFTAQRLSGKDKRWMNVGVVMAGFASPMRAAPSPRTDDAHFGGGHSGGGGATGDF